MASTSLSPSPEEAIYAELTSFFRSASTSASFLEAQVEILPSKYPLPTEDPSVVRHGVLLRDGSDLAIRKADLAVAFLRARQRLLRYRGERREKEGARGRVSKSESSSSVAVGPREQQLEEECGGRVRDETEEEEEKEEDEEIDGATAVILLFDPEHLTAANERKRLLLRRIRRLQLLVPLQTPASTGQAGVASTSPSTTFLEEEKEKLFSRELALLSTLLTSPLRRHTKSPTLWHHRYWTVEQYIASQQQQQQQPRAERAALEEKLEKLWQAEHTKTILRAADRHFSNYYAFDYARKITALLPPSPETQQLVVSTLQTWCLSHPSDVSGWTYFASLLLLLFASGRGRGGVGGGEGSGKATVIVKEALQITRKFVQSVGWKGESVQVFLKAMAMALASDEESMLEK